MKLRPYSEAKSLPLKWEKSANHILQFTGTTTTYTPALYLGGLEESSTVEAGKRADLVLLEGKQHQVDRNQPGLKLSGLNMESVNLNETQLNEPQIAAATISGGS